MRKVTELVRYARNARTHSRKQIDQVATAMRRWGWTMPVLVRAETSGIIAGHCRVLAAQRLGIEQIPTIEAHAWSDAEVRASTRKGDLVLDPFGGSGSTLITCDRLGRRARLIELDAKFVDVVVRRWQKNTDDVATLEASGQSFATIADARAQSCPG